VEQAVRILTTVVSREGTVRSSNRGVKSLVSNVIRDLFTENVTLHKEATDVRRLYMELLQSVTLDSYRATDTVNQL
jgi:hypothetical protein